MKANDILSKFEDNGIMDIEIYPLMSVIYVNEEQFSKLYKALKGEEYDGILTIKKAVQLDEKLNEAISSDEEFIDSLNELVEKTISRIIGEEFKNTYVE